MTKTVSIFTEVDVNLKDVVEEIPNEYLLSTLKDRIFSSNELLELEGIFTSKVNPIDSMKIRHFLSIMDDYSLNQIETALPSKQ
jgi:hypothetical protein